MARSTYIYVVRGAGHLVAAFTVKHELVTWLRRRVATGPDLGDYYRVTRLRDGEGPESAVFMGTAGSVIDGA